MSATPMIHIDSDRLVHLARGTAASDAESRHLVSCAECRTEVDMVAAASRLGRGRLPGIDAARVAVEVRRRLAAVPSVPAGRSVVRSGWWLGGLTAAAMAIFAVRSVVNGGAVASVEGVLGVPVVVSVLHELDDLDEPQLEDVLRSLPRAAGELDHVEMAPLGSLNAADLEQMLQSMEE